MEAGHEEECIPDYQGENENPDSQAIMKAMEDNFKLVNLGTAMKKNPIPKKEMRICKQL